MASRNVSCYGLFFGGPWTGRSIPMAHVRSIFDVLLSPKDVMAVSVEALVPKDPTWQVIRYHVTGQVKAHDDGKVRIYTIYEPEKPGKKGTKIGRKLYNTLHDASYAWVCEAVVENIEIKRRYLDGEFHFEVPGEG